MSISMATTSSALTQLGVSVGDVATLYTLGRRVGNWMTAASGDHSLLQFLDQDESDVLTRRGLVDIRSFNKRWSKAFRILINGEPQCIQNEVARKAMDNLPRFTAIMVCITAALDVFASEFVSRLIIAQLLKNMMRATEYGEDVLNSEISSRIKSWRSWAVVRGLLVHAMQVRSTLLDKKLIIEGWIPAGEATSVVDFLTWLLTTNKEVYTTSSSDVAGLATCLSHLGLDILSVSGLDSDGIGTSCRLEYTAQQFLHDPNSLLQAGLNRLFRQQSTPVSLTQPGESFSLFPISPDTANRCRLAWSGGHEASKKVELRVVIPEQGDNGRNDLKYQVINHGAEVSRQSKELWALADKHAFVLNEEFFEQMKDVGIADYSPELLEWLRKQTDDTDERPGNIGHHETDDQRLIDAFTVFQAFILGYYYGVVLSVVDTETLEFKSVDGGWGYRTGYGLNIIRTEISKAKPKTTSGMVVFGRQVILRISSLLLFSNDTQIAEITGTRWCLGVVGKRALLASSLIRGCHSPQDIGRFILLDVDVGGVPTSSDGLVRGGDGEYLEKDYVDETAVSISKYGGDEDFTRHIEPDWEGNPELMLLCIRYKGRRITTLNPAVADTYFCLAYLPPIPNPAADQVLNSAIYCGIDAFLAGKLPQSRFTTIPVIVQAKGKPCMRYVAAATYSTQLARGVFLVSNCIHAANQEPVNPLYHTNKNGGRVLIV